MSKNNKKTETPKFGDTPVVSGKNFRNPVNKLSGRIMIWVLIAAMVIGVLVSLGFIIYGLLTRV